MLFVSLYHLMEKRKCFCVGQSCAAFEACLLCAVQDFSNVVKEPGRVVLGAVLQYTIMPLMGWLVSKLAGLPTPFAIGYASQAAFAWPARTSEAFSSTDTHNLALHLIVCDLFSCMHASVPLGAPQTCCHSAGKCACSNH